MRSCGQQDARDCATRKQEHLRHAQQVSHEPQQLPNCSRCDVVAAAAVAAADAVCHRVCAHLLAMKLRNSHDWPVCSSVTQRARARARRSPIKCAPMQNRPRRREFSRENFDGSIRVRQKKSCSHSAVDARANANQSSQKCACALLIASP